jgi:hypothetical protein
MIATAGPTAGYHILDVDRIETYLVLQAIENLRHAALWVNFTQRANPRLASAAW